MRRYFYWALAAAGLLLYLFGSQIITLLTDLLWFTSLGYRSVKVTMIRTQVVLGLVQGTLFFLILYANLWIARRWAPPVPRLYQEIGLGERIGEFARHAIDRLLLFGSLLAALFAGLIASNYGQDYLLWRNPTPFGIKDPLFNKDVGYYIFQLPFVLYLYRWLFVTLLLSFLATAWVHWSDRALQFAQNIPVPRFAPHVKVHLSVLLALILFTLSVGYWYRRYDLLQSDFGLLSLNGAGYTDVHARLLAYQLMSIGWAIVGVLLLVNLGMRGLTLPAVGIVVVAGLSVVVGVVYPSFMQSYVVAPSDVKLEQPYIGHNINFTRSAYGLGNIQVVPYNADADLTGGILAQHRDTLRNVRLWDYSALERVYNQQQGLKPYYTFQDVDVDRYQFPTGNQQVMVAAREINQAQLPQKTWVAQRLQYTHGYGAIMSPVNAVTTEGSAEYLLKDMPPQPVPALKNELTLTRPQIYFGTQPNDYVIVNTDQPEFDYPSGTEEKTVTYEGKKGVPVGSYGRKMLFGLRFGDSNFLLSKLIGSNGQVLFHRQIQDRIQTLAPFLLPDRDPYLVIAEGKLHWIIDLYTATDRYPYSQPIQNAGINYLRNSVKAVVDAYDGTTTFYVFDPKDPLIQSYRRIFPALFQPKEKFPPALLPHIRYPEDLFNVQSRLFRRYHMQEPQRFYTQSDAWELATSGQPTAQGQDPEPMEPYYVTMRLPGTNRLNFILMRPFTPVGKTNMAAWMAAQCDPENLGKMVVYEFPKNSLTQGPAQIRARIQQDAEISRNVSLWDTQGSRIHWGNLLVIPLGKAMLYVQPLYLESQAGSARMPELKQVIVATDQPQRVLMRPTLDEALSALVNETVDTREGSSAEATETPTEGGRNVPQNAAALIRAANRHFEAAETAQRNGDWAAYGRELSQLRQTLRQLGAQSQGD